MSDTERQEPPYAVQIEPTEGCNLRCAFCAVSSIREPGARGERSGPYKYMIIELADRIAQSMADAGWNSRVEFAMHGEPTMNPDLVHIVRRFRTHLPRASLMLTTNGEPLLEPPGWAARVDALYRAGLNIVALDDYKPHRVAPVARAERLAGVEYREYPAEPEGNPHRRRTKRDRRLLTILADISEQTEGTHSNLNNHAGCAAPPPAEPLMKRCVKPFREFSVRWDGNVAVCCNDWRGEHKVGNVAERGVDDLWQDESFRAARRYLYHADRRFGVCAGCDDPGGYRVGLITHGRELPEPDDRDAETVARAMSGEPYTPAVERKWETAITLSRKPASPAGTAATTPTRGPASVVRP